MNSSVFLVPEITYNVSSGTLNPNHTISCLSLVWLIFRTCSNNLDATRRDTSTGNEQIEQLAEYNDKHRVVNAQGEVIYSSSIFIFITTSLTNSQENQQVIHILTVS